MSDHFAVIDVGSNAIRLQVAEVSHPKIYQVVKQDRQPVRLGKDVFKTGVLNQKSAQDAIAVLAEYKALADKYKIEAMRAVATSALREASDRRTFIANAKNIGIPLALLSEEDEARLISLGVMSGLRFHLPLGLFLDIGGGSVELSVANSANMFCLFSLPLGAVRLTEAFLREDPPRGKDVRALREHVQDKLAPAIRRIGKEKFTMAFGSGGTLTALAETENRIAGENQNDSLAIIRRSRLRTLLDVLRGLPANERVSLIKGDPKRADIVVAGGFVLYEVMSALGLDYFFVTRSGLRDGLMVDLLQRHYNATEPWHPEAERAESLEQVCQKYLYDERHAKHVSQLALNMYYQLQELHQLPDRFASILHGAAMLHDIGLFVSREKHHKHSYYLIKSSGMSSYSKLDLDLIASIARYHRKAHPSQRHLGFSQLSPKHQDIVRKLSAILRIADALDFRGEERVKGVNCTRDKAGALSITASSQATLRDELAWAQKKARLFGEVFNVKLMLSASKANSGKH